MAHIDYVFYVSVMLDDIINAKISFFCYPWILKLTVLQKAEKNSKGYYYFWLRCQIKIIYLFSWTENYFRYLNIVLV